MLNCTCDSVMKGKLFFHKEFLDSSKNPVVSAFTLQAVLTFVVLIDTDFSYHDLF